MNTPDWTVWNDTKGSVPSPTAVTADGNDDGSINAADEDVWAANFGHTLSMTFVIVI